MDESTPYRAYLIRLWPSSRGGQADCRISLEDVATRERRNFADLESLFGFLLSHAGSLPPAGSLETERSSR